MKDEPAPWITPTPKKHRTVRLLQGRHKGLELPVLEEDAKSITVAHPLGRANYPKERCLGIDHFEDVV